MNLFLSKKGKGICQYVSVSSMPPPSFARRSAQLQPMVNAAHELLISHGGAGSDFLGWTTLPEDYDRAEFARIKAAAERIRKSCQVFIAIGIGGSYLGARAVIEFVKSPLYNNLRKDTPDIYFAGNCISVLHRFWVKLRTRASAQTP